MLLPGSGRPAHRFLHDVGERVDTAQVGTHGVQRADPLEVSTGEVTLDERSLASWTRRELARRVAIVPQELHPAFDYTVLEMALMGRFPHLGAFAVEGPGDIAIAREALEATGAAAFEARRFSTLSGGEKQRVIVAAALAQTPCCSTSRRRRWIPGTRSTSRPCLRS